MNYELHSPRTDRRNSPARVRAAGVLASVVMLTLAGCAGADVPAETQPVTPPTTADDTETAPEPSAPASTPTDSEPTDSAPTNGELPTDYEDLVILAVNDFTIECEDWCVSPEQDQFEAAEWTAIDDGEAIYRFTVLEGETLDLEHITEQSDSYPAWEDVISADPDGQYIEVMPIRMESANVQCDEECMPADDIHVTDGVRLLYDVSSGEAVYAGISGTH